LNSFDEVDSVHLSQLIELIKAKHYAS